jgi:hypothetical protein
MPLLRCRLGLLLLSCLALGRAAAAPLHTCQAFHYPDETEHFRFVGAENYDDFRLGFQLRYVILESDGCPGGGSRRG